MSFIDQAKEAVAENLDKAKDLISENADKIEASIEKAGDFIDDKTGGKFKFNARNADDKVANAERLSRRKSKGQTLDIDFEKGSTLPAIGILGEMGYHVGYRGLLPPARREILRRTFEVKLIPTEEWTVGYARDCGKRCTEARWNKMRQVLYGLNAKAERKLSADMSKSISDREHDLDWLTDDYEYWLTRNYPD